MNKRRIGLALVITFVVEAMNRLSPLLVLHIALERLGIERFGYAQFGMSLIELAIPFIAFGYPIVVAKELGRVQQSTGKINSAEVGTTLASMISLRLIHAFVAFVTLVTLCLLIPSYRDYLSLVIALSFMLVTSAIELTAVQAATQKTHIVNLSLGLAKIASLAAIFFFVGSENPTTYAVLTLGANAAVAVASLAIASRQIRLSLPRLSVMSRLFRSALGIAAVYLLLTALERVDIMIAERLYGTLGAGLYAGPARLGQSIQHLIGALGIIFMSELMVISDRTSYTKHVNTAFNLTSFFVIPLMVGSWFVDGELLRLVYGTSYDHVSRLLSLVVVAAGAQCLITIFGLQVLLLKGEISRLALSLLGGLIILVLLGTWLGSHYELYGVAAASVLAKLIAGLFIAHAAQRHLAPLSWMPLLRSAFSAGLMGLFLWILDSDKLWLNISAGACIFLGASLLFNRAEVQSLIKAFRQRSR